MIDHIGISVGSIARATEFYLIGNFRIEGVLLEGLDGARTWPPSVAVCITSWPGAKSLRFLPLLVGEAVIVPSEAFAQST